MKKLLGLLIIAGLVPLGACFQKSNQQAEKDKLQHELDSIKKAQMEQQKLDSIAKVQKAYEDSMANEMQKLKQQKSAAETKAKTKETKKEGPKPDRRVRPAEEKAKQPQQGRNA